MNAQSQTWFALAIVLVASAFLAHSIWHSLRGSSGGCGCGKKKKAKK